VRSIGRIRVVAESLRALGPPPRGTTMKAFLIAPEHRSIEAIDIANRDDIAKIIGYDTIESDAVGTGSDRLFFDEECFLRGTGGRFQVDKLIPISGRAVVVGVAGDGTMLCDAAVDIDNLRGRIKYL
jgi:hypothetical protein